MLQKQNKANIDKQNAAGKTPLIIAIEKSALLVIFQLWVLLLNAGANPNIQDASGKTAS